MDKDNKTTKHIGEQTSLTQNRNRKSQSSQTENSSNGNYNTQKTNSLKPCESLKGFTSELENH